VNLGRRRREPWSLLVCWRRIDAVESTCGPAPPREPREITRDHHVQSASRIERSQIASCAQLWAEKTRPPSPQQAQTIEKAVHLLREDPAMRKAFIDKVAGPVANKMFECGMIP
jgi:hypothetical protein